MTANDKLAEGLVIANLAATKGKRMRPHDAIGFPRKPDCRSR